MLNATLPRVTLYLIAGAVAVVALILIAHTWNRITARLPWSAESRLERVERDLAFTTSDRDARALEVAGERQQAAQAQARHTREVIIREITVQAVTQAQGAPDADQPLDPARLDRLRAHDHGLCETQPRVCAPAPAGDPDRG